MQHLSLICVLRVASCGHRRSFFVCPLMLDKRACKLFKLFVTIEKLISLFITSDGLHLKPMVQLIVNLKTGCAVYCSASHNSNKFLLVREAILFSIMLIYIYFNCFEVNDGGKVFRL